jgi:hypothetical protein
MVAQREMVAGWVMASMGQGGASVGGWSAPWEGAFGLLEASSPEALRALETYMRAQAGDALGFAQAHQALLARAAWGHALVARWAPELDAWVMAQVGDAHWALVRGDEIVAWRWGRIPMDDYYEGSPAEGVGALVATRARRERMSWLGVLDGLPHHAPWPSLSAVAALPGDVLVLGTRGVMTRLSVMPQYVIEACARHDEAACGLLLEAASLADEQRVMMVWR